ncbi:MAG TPA: response regulator [Bryobacteraceae bacterium]|jgi:DNA-binding response OmpR family regulator|nr:response regulator [Bryobacteraceae bacterium]
MLLVISHSEQDYQAIRSVVPENAGPVRLAQTAREGLAFLSSYPVEVVVCERDLPDGDWRGILSATWHLPKPPLLIVISRHADESLWAEVLNLGGYDVLLKPFYRDELARVIQQAFRCGSVVRGRAKATSAA